MNAFGRFADQCRHDGECSGGGGHPQAAAKSDW
jgi:hypothetical protein